MNIRNYEPEERGTSAGITAGLMAGAIGFGAGMLTMYFLDPSRGTRRRALIIDKFSSARHRIPRAARVTARDVSNRVRGTIAEISNRLYSDEASDPVIEARVRSKLGRACSHPHSVHVTSHDGRVVLDGVILTNEVPGVLCAAEAARGVSAVENRMRAYDSAQNIPSLQSAGARESKSELIPQIRNKPSQIH